MLAGILREHRLASAHSQARDFVFASATGGPLGHRNFERRGLERAADAAGLNDGNRPRLRLHDLRHTFASGLIHDGLDPRYVAGQLGHADASVTYRIYSGAFNTEGKAERAKAARAARFHGTTLEPNGGVGRRQRVASGGGEVAPLRRSGTDGD